MASWISRLRAAGSGPGQELCPHAEALEQRRQAGVVLPRQDLGRSHQRPLPPGANGACQRHGRDRGLAAADVALQQAAHRSLAGDLVDDLGDGRFLVIGQGEGQRRDDLGPGGIGYRDARRSESGTRLPRLRERQLEGEQLVEGQAVERLGHVGRLLGEVRGAQGVVERRQAPAFLVGQWVDDRWQRAIQDARQQLAEPLLGHAGGEVVDRDDARGVHRLATDRAELRRRELRTPAPLRHLARDDHLVPLLKPPLDESAAEPDRLGAAGVVGELGDHPLRLPAEAGLHADRRHGHPRGLLLVGHQLAQRTELAEVVVAEREVPEGLASRRDAEPAEGGGAPRQLGHRAPDRLIELVRCGDAHALTARLDCMARS